MASWTLAHLFTPEETGQPTTHGYGWSLMTAVVYATPDGTLWAGANESAGGGTRRGTIMRSVDGGATWSRADGTRYAAMNGGHGFAVGQFLLARDGRLDFAMIKKANLPHLALVVLLLLRQALAHCTAEGLGVDLPPPRARPPTRRTCH